MVSEIDIVRYQFKAGKFGKKKKKIEMWCLYFPIQVNRKEIVREFANITVQLCYYKDGEIF